MAATLEYSGIEASNGLVCEPSFEFATLPDLPNELLFIIIHNLDNESLFNLGLTCRRMNTIALNHFFSKNDIGDPETGFFVDWRSDLPIQTIPALRSALFVHRIQYFHLVLNPNTKRVHEEVADLCVLAERLHTIGAFSLSFHHIDNHSFSLPGMRILTTGNMWYQSVTGLLDNVLDKSCSRLYLNGGARFSELCHGLVPTPYRPPPVDGQPIKINKISHLARQRTALNTLRRLPTPKLKSVSILSPQIPMNGVIMTEVVQPHERNNIELKLSDIQSTNIQNADTEPSLANSKQATQATPSPLRNLSLAQIHSDMLLHFPFSKWTLSTLNAASSTLTKLSLIITVDASGAWKTFSGNLFLPLLKDFSLSNDTLVPANVAEFVDVEDFLMNHPSIQILHLYGVQMPPSLEIAPRPIFQNLVKFNGHPNYIIWLLKRVKIDKTALPNLESLTISSENYRCDASFDYTLFEPALEAVAESHRNFVLAFTFNCRNDITDWLESHVRKAQGHEGSIFSRLCNISTLVVSDSWYFTPSMITIIPDWLQLFPNLRKVRFECDMPISTEQLTDPAFVATVAILCPDLETMMVDWGHTFDLRQVRLEGGC